jgi:hypothetical protein
MEIFKESTVQLGMNRAISLLGRVAREPVEGGTNTGVVVPNVMPAGSIYRPICEGG